MTILCVGIPEDIQLSYFISYLDKEKVDYYFLNQRDFKKDISINSKGIKKNNRLLYKFSDFSGVYNRLASISYNEKQNRHEYDHHQKAYFALLILIESECSNVVNTLQAGTSNDSKPYQLCFSSQSRGFLKIPPTQVLLNTNKLIIQSPLICKSTSSVRSIVSSVEAQNIIKSEIKSPLLIQEEIVGSDIRVHVVGEKLICTRVDSSEVDYRYNLDAVYKEFFPNSKIIDDCLSLSKNLDLPLVGIDLIEKNDEYYFLEANPSPGFYFYEQRLKEKPISKALMELLKG